MLSAQNEYSHISIMQAVASKHICLRMHVTGMMLRLVLKHNYQPWQT
jgi:hypothetical protein